MIGRLVEEQQVGLDSERLRERDALAQAARELGDDCIRRQGETVDQGFDTRSDAPAVRVFELVLQIVETLELR